MRAPKALILGATGMLGRAIANQLIESGVETLVASRSQGIKFDVLRDSSEQLMSVAGIALGDVIVNCIGLTKSKIDEADTNSIAKAVQINALFPMLLSQAAHRVGAQVIQVATDCVFSGRSGNYREDSPHDAIDVYGKTKSLGEAKSENLMHLRCSLVGPEARGRKSLFFEWVRNLPRGAEVVGFTDHKWNGLTSQAFGAVVAGILNNRMFRPGVQHLVPADSLTKSELVKMELSFLRRTDVIFSETETGNPVDRTLATLNTELNKEFFSLAGFREVPTIREMMEQLRWEDLKIR